jgi:hypothetical protein
LCPLLIHEIICRLCYRTWKNHKKLLSSCTPTLTHHIKLLFSEYLISQLETFLIIPLSKPESSCLSLLKQFVIMPSDCEIEMTHSVTPPVALSSLFSVSRLHDSSIVFSTSFFTVVEYSGSPLHFEKVISFAWVGSVRDCYMLLVRSESIQTP